MNKTYLVERTAYGSTIFTRWTKRNGLRLGRKVISYTLPCLIMSEEEITKLYETMREGRYRAEHIDKY